MLISIQTELSLLLLKTILFKHLNNIFYQWYFVFTYNQAVVADYWHVVRGVPRVLADLICCKSLIGVYI